MFEAILLTLVVVTADGQPHNVQAPMPTLKECLQRAEEFLSDKGVADSGITIAGASCVVQFKPRV
jgi:hypothetical protein